MKSIFSAGVVVFFLCLRVSSGQIVVAQHLGATNPTSEGFTALNFTATSTGSAISTPENAWEISDTAGSGGNPQYRYTPSAGELAALAPAFIIEGRINIPGNSQAADNSAIINLSFNGGNSYNLRFGSDASGNAIVNLTGTGGGTFNLSSGGFHDYKLVFENGAGALYVDGAITSFTSYTGGTGASVNQFRFGDITTGDRGTADYALVRISTIPEPSATCLFSAVIVTAFGLSQFRMSRPMPGKGVERL